jgi:hypothetical protein
MGIVAVSNDFRALNTPFGTILSVLLTGDQPTAAGSLSISLRLRAALKAMQELAALRTVYRMKPRQDSEIALLFKRASSPSH